MAVSINEFQKAVLKLEDALSQQKTEYIRDSVIQRFEFSVELAWKTSKKIMGTRSTSPKDVVREMAQNNYIANINEWLVAIDMRNLTSHTYNEDKAEKVYYFSKSFLPELKTLVEVLLKK